MNTHKLVRAAIVGALYIALTLAFAPISFGTSAPFIQFRIAEALTVLPFLFPETALGLFVGCLLGNLLGGAVMPDIIFGSLTTLLAAFLCSKIRIRWLAPLPAVVLNALIVGTYIPFLYMDAPEPWVLVPASILGVAVGQAVVCFTLGLTLLLTLPRIKFFQNEIQKR